MKILLASKSPRRRELLSQLGYELAFVDIDFDESTVKSTQMPIETTAQTLAHSKAAAYDTSTLDDNTVLVTADTVVALDDKALGKPANRDEAIAMLQSLSGRAHTVYTGVCVRGRTAEKLFTEATQVHFRQLSDGEICYYVDTYRPYDKAGAYGIQEWIGMIGIERIEGDYYNVMGLPVCSLNQVLASWSL